LETIAVTPVSKGKLAAARRVGSVPSVGGERGKGQESAERGCCHKKEPSATPMASITTVMPHKRRPEPSAETAYAYAVRSTYAAAGDAQSSVVVSHDDEQGSGTPWEEATIV